jgi:replicative DNA helicase
MIHAKEILLASSVLMDADPVRFLNLKLNDEIVGEGYKDLFQYLRSFVLDYGKIPAAATVKEQFDFKFIKVPETPEYYRDALFQSYKQKTIFNMCKMANDMSKAGETEKALELIMNKTSSLKLLSNQESVVNFTSQALTLFDEHYQKQMLMNDDGMIKSGWATFDKLNGGITGGDILSLVGRPGTGKTYLCLYMAIYAWLYQKKSPIFVSMEIKTAALIQRIIAIYTKTYVSDLKKAAISTKKKADIEQQLISLEGMPPFWVIDGNLSSSVSDIEGWVNELKPDFAVVDGAYLIEEKGKYSKSMHEKVKDSCEGVKKNIAGKYNIPVILSYQFNRESTKLSKADKAGLEHIGGSDAIGQVSSIVLGVFQGDDQADQLKDKKIIIMKGREGETGEFNINWLFNSYPAMNFSEILEKDKIMGYV